MRKNRISFPEAEDCPCGSSKIYGACCKPKGIRFERDGRGGITRVVAIPDELAVELAAMEERFRAIYGRKPGKGDKVLFEQYLSLGDEHWREMRRVGEQAGIRPQVIFCSQRTGYIIVQGQEHLFTDMALAEWEQASAEYDAIVDDGIDPFAFLDFKDRAEYETFNALKELLDATIILFGSLIDRNQRKLDGVEKFVILYYVSRAFNALKLLRFVCSDRPARDAVGLSRPVYECLLRIRFVHTTSDAAETFLKQAEVGRGSVRYKTDSQGNVKRGWLIDVKTGREYRSRFNFKEMAEAPGDVSDTTLYDEVYPLLSSVTHADLSDLSLFFSESDGYFHQGHAENVVEAPLIAVVLSTMLLGELSRSPKFGRLSRRDAAYFSRETAKRLLDLEQGGINLLSALSECKRRLQAIGSGARDPN
jgi:hypothetical protein